MIAAAGSGQRLGAGGPKALVELCGRPMISWSLDAFAAAATIERIVVAAPLGFEAEFGDLAGADVAVVPGGATRAESVRLAMDAVGGELVAIHDAARPLLTPDLVDRIVTRLAATEADGVIAAAAVADTLKRAGDGDAVVETVKRAGLWAAQTPQAFRVAALLGAQRAAADSGSLETATDEAGLIEWAGGTVLLEAVGEPNLKVTTAADLAVATSLLGRG